MKSKIFFGANPCFKCLIYNFVNITSNFGSVGSMMAYGPRDPSLNPTPPKISMNTVSELTGVVLNQT